MDSLREGLAALGVSVESVHTEVFGTQRPIMPGVVAPPIRPPHQPEGEPGSGPLISFVRTGLNVRWSEGSTSILELAEACDVPVQWSCRTGVCHTCETGLLDGRVDYSPEPLEEPADGNLLVCCSRPETDLAIDL
jgi:ferredoxin